MAHRQISQIVRFSAFCFLPLRLLSSPELKAGAIEGAAFSSWLSLAPPYLPQASPGGRGFSLSPPRFEPLDNSTGVEPDAPNWLRGR
jgi:hypothetical protein